MLILRRVAVSPGWLPLHSELPLCLKLLLHLKLPDHLCLNLTYVLLSMPYRRLQRQFMTFSMDRKSDFNELRIVHNTLLMLWNS